MQVTVVYIAKVYGASASFWPYANGNQLLRLYCYDAELNDDEATLLRPKPSSHSEKHLPGKAHS